MLLCNLFFRSFFDRSFLFSFLFSSYNEDRTAHFHIAIIVSIKKTKKHTYIYRFNMDTKAWDIPVSNRMGSLLLLLLFVVL